MIIEMSLRTIRFKPLIDLSNILSKAILIDLLEDIANKLLVISLKLSLKISFVNTLILTACQLGKVKMPVASSIFREYRD